MLVGKNLEVHLHGFALVQIVTTADVHIAQLLRCLQLDRLVGRDGGMYTYTYLDSTSPPILVVNGHTRPHLDFMSAAGLTAVDGHTPRT
jgi:hypothetical protein